MVEWRIIMILKSLKSNKFTKVSLSLIILMFLALFTGFFEILFMQYQATITLYLDSIHFPIPLTFYLDSGVLMTGIGVGILSTFVEKKKKLWFYSSVLIVLFGFGILAVIMGYSHPCSVGSGIQVNDLRSFFTTYVNLVIHNFISASLALLSGLTVVGPFVVLSNDILMVVSLFASFTTFYGYKGVILFLGMFHIYIETFAIFSSCLAGIRVALISFQSFLRIRNNGFFNSMKKIKDAMAFEIVNTMPKIVVLLVIAALLEVLWTPFWINYWLHYIL